MPAISVVIPLYNKRNYIWRCIRSVCSQTTPDFEVIVIDDGSTDGSAEVAATFPDGRVRVIRQKNRGVGAARNRGIRESTGELVAFLDGDDEWLPQFLQSVEDLRNRYPEAGMFATGYRRRTAYGFDTETTLVAPADGHNRLIFDYFQLAVRGNFVTSSSVAVRRSILLESGAFPEGEPFGEDRDLWARIALTYPVAFDTRILAIYHSEADGRACNSIPVKAPYPPIFATLREALRDERLSRVQLRGIRAYLDLLRIQYAYRQLTMGCRSDADRLLREKYHTSRFRAEALALQFLSKLLPTRLIMALRMKPVTVLTLLRRSSFGSGHTWREGDLVIRQFPSELTSS
jgi:glycosyltransferase involved in cell wall biosynthesis